MNWLARLLGQGVQLDSLQKARLEAWHALPGANLKRPLSEGRFVVVDVESSGLDLNKDYLIAIGAIAVHGNKIDYADGLDIVLQQKQASGKDNILIHGIGGEVQCSGVPPADALLTLLEYLGKDPLLAFHVAFDSTMISKAMRQFLGLRFQHPWADLAYLAPELCPDAARSHRSLDDWMRYFSIGNFARHSALADAISTAELLLALHPLMVGRHFDTFHDLQGIEQDRRMRTFGLPYA
jgi:DNA polymerase-3 subunit epsilon